ncbi:MAG: type II toxin-antitoxin system RelE/ParE family toxin [Syntrophomonadaceae bacterium]|nr:type II toxin-antitoxin system RelE/ParE family toxin [Syntrophomonadaceae bacterium]
MKYDIVLTEPAHKDLIEITGDILKKHGQTSLAQKLVNQIADTIDDLEKTPFRHALVSDEKLVTNGVRTVMLDNQIVFYIASEQDKTVSIVRILDFRRNWDTLL